MQEKNPAHPVMHAVKIDYLMKIRLGPVNFLANGI